MEYVSTCGGIGPLSFEEAVLMGKPEDGGLFVPVSLPYISLDDLNNWKQLQFKDLAFEIISRFAGKSDLNAKDLKYIIDQSFETFTHPEIIPSFSLVENQNIYLQELFHGPSLSFKDVAMGFVINLFEYFLKRKGKNVSLVVATTGDTGPAAAVASKGKSSINTWLFYPVEFITEEQRRQMTTLDCNNVHPVGVRGCPDGADDLDLLIKDMFTDNDFRNSVNLSSVNSINWARVMMQTVHYFYGYLRTVDSIGEDLVISVPSGAFGNLCAGSIARMMGLPIKSFIVATNRNDCLHQIFSRGIFEKKELINCPSSAIDILIPINFWRYLYLAIKGDSAYIRKKMKVFDNKGKVEFEKEIYKLYSKGYLSTSVSDNETISRIKNIYSNTNYVLDPHGAVAVEAALNIKKEFKINEKILCMATAHPSKFPGVLKDIIDDPSRYAHPSIEQARSKAEKAYTFEYKNMRREIRKTMLQFNAKTDESSQ